MFCFRIFYEYFLVAGLPIFFLKDSKYRCWYLFSKFLVILQLNFNISFFVRMLKGLNFVLSIFWFSIVLKIVKLPLKFHQTSVLIKNVNRNFLRQITLLESDQILIILSLFRCVGE